MNATAHRLTTTDRTGFSLIEVLIAVLVLAIGMLGLGAVFPAIIAEQRDSFEVVEGENAAGAAAAIITNKEMLDFSFVSDSFNKAQDNADNRYEHLWAVPDFGPNPYTFGDTQFPGFNFVTGLWGFDMGSPPVIPANERYVSELPLSARLYPMPYSGKDPRFVWDLALRRKPAGDRLQAAIFVRRIDARIRIPKDYSLSDVLTGSGGIAVDDTRLPVGIINDGSPRSGNIAVDQGPGDAVFYAIIQSLKTEVYSEHLDWLVFTDGRSGNVDSSVNFATKVGQKLVDNTGVVRTVVGIPQVENSDPLYSDLGPGGSKRAVIVDPPFLVSNAGGEDTDDVSPGSNAQDNDYDDERASWVRQVIFTPRTPVAVRVITLGDES